MLRNVLYLGGVIFFTMSCKKDLLHFNKVRQLNSNTTSKLNHIKFISEHICIASGGILYQQSEIDRSTDGGYTWSSSSDTNAEKEMFGMSISYSGVLFLTGIDGDVLQSKDSGNTWQFNRVYNWLANVSGTFATRDTGIFLSSLLQRQCSITRVDSAFNILDQQTFLFGASNIYMVSANVGYVIGYGTVMKTTDRGNNWIVQDVVGDNFMAMDIHGDEIWMCGYAGSVYHTTDGGAHWQKQRNGNDITLPRYDLLDIKFKDEQNGWAVCDDGKVLHSDDGGNHWEEYDRFTTNALRSIAICPNNDLLVAGDNGNIFRITP
jgi:photosystem II stability/assembly factor-like uncharacterized protein